jgi:hypothetical protein
MAQTGDVKVSNRGQMALPAQTRHRWGLDEGGVIGWVDSAMLCCSFPAGRASSVRPFSVRPTGMLPGLASEIQNSQTSRESASSDRPR